MIAKPQPDLHEAALVGHFGIPAADPWQPREQVVWPPRRARAALRALHAAKGRARRRLAYFPWRRSGFRYHEALALHERRPDTLFFSQWRLTDAFPAPVRPLAEFPRIALRAGITDVYAVFLRFLEGLCGLAPLAPGGEPHPMDGPDLWSFLRAARFRVHGSVYPGGGYTATPEALERVRALGGRLDTTFSYIPEVLAAIPGVTPVPQAFTDTAFYRRTDDRWSQTDPLVGLFAADRAPRKGIDVALAAVRELGGGFHLHVVGPHEDRTPEVPPGRATFHGWLDPEGLRALHRRTHVFLSPVQVEPPGAPRSDVGVVDGFPTQAATDAMSSGCLLVSANPAEDRRVLRPDEHYLERPADPRALRATLQELRANPARMRAIADAGTDRVRERMGVDRGVEAKLAAMGLYPST
jgi:glycosyltransferase involved in cell wall biosynthesis